MRKYVPHLLTLFIICGMTAASEALGEAEIIFPEAAAVAAGVLVAPKLPWRTGKVRIFVLIMISALLGMGISLFMPGPLWLKMAAAYLVGLTVLTFSGTGFAPMISAVVLPVMLQSRSWFYLASAAVFILLILVFRVIVERFGIRDKIEFVPIPIPRERAYWLRFIGKIITAVILIAVFVPTGFRFAAAPPLLVAFTEFSNPGSKPAKIPFKSVALLIMCAVGGAYMRLIFSVYLQLPLVVPALIAGIIAILLLESLRLYLPPAAAITVLAMLIPEESLLLYPIQIAVGSAAIMAVSLVFFRGRKCAAAIDK